MHRPKQISIYGPTYVIGDIHGHPQSIDKNKLDYLDKGSNLILLGDIGMGFNIPIFHDLVNYLKDFNVYLIRGNHDDPGYWDSAPYSIRNITFLQDGYITINGELYLVVGGGISVDKNMSHRKRGVTWWDGEEVSYKIPKRGKKIKAVLSHSGPTPESLPPKVSGYPDPDGSINAYIEKENNLWNSIIRKFKPDLWYHGHFHMSCSQTIKTTKVHSLDCAEIKLL